MPRRLRTKPASYQWLYAPRMDDNTPRRLIAIYDRIGRLLELHNSDGALTERLHLDRYRGIGRLPTVYITEDEYIRWYTEHFPGRGVRIQMGRKEREENQRKVASRAATGS